MTRAGLNPTSLSKAVHGKTKQPQIHRFVAGTAIEPKRSTLQPVADHFGIPVDALFDPREASRVAQQLGIGPDASTQHLAPAPAPTGLSLHDAMERVGVALAQAMPADDRAELADVMAMWARYEGKDKYRKAAEELLAEPQASAEAEPGKRNGTR